MDGKVIFEYWSQTDEDDGHYKLRSSSICSSNSLLVIKSSDAMIFCEQYSTFVSPIHNLTASPGEILWQECENCEWEAEGESNGFTLKALSQTIYCLEEGTFQVETIYDIPAEYTGPHYKKRVITFDHATKQIKKIVMTYEDGKVDVGEFDCSTKGAMKIKWTCQYGPNKENLKYLPA